MEKAIFALKYLVNWVLYLDRYKIKGIIKINYIPVYLFEKNANCERLILRITFSKAQFEKILHKIKYRLHSNNWKLDVKN